MSTIPASYVVNILPSALSAGGNGLILNGMAIVSTSALANEVTDPGWRVPIGTVASFPSSLAVGKVFGQTSDIYKKSVIYFNGYTNASQLPGSLLVAQWPKTNAFAWLLGAPSTSLIAVQAVNGTLTVTVDGYSRVASSLNLSAASSFTAAATLIATALNTTPASAATVTAAIAPVTGTFTGNIAGDLLTVTSVPTSTIVAGAVLSGSLVVSGTQIVDQLDGTPGGTGTYAVSTYQNTASQSITMSYGTMTVSAVASGTVSVGQAVTGGATLANTVVTQDGTGSGLTGTYFVNLTQTVASGTLTLVSANLNVTYDSQSGGFLITSGITGVASTIAFATGSTAAGLKLTSVTGATISQGANAIQPAPFMNGVIQVTQNWASFFLIGDPDDGNGNTQKLEFAAWTSAQNNRYGFICWDTDITPTLSNPATNSLGYLINTVFAYTGTLLIYDPTNQGLAAFNAGIAASLNFGELNGRTTFAFRNQAGLVAQVMTQSVAANLEANGYTFYAVLATANQQFIWNFPGNISGPFLWADSFFNQVWMNSQFQLALMELLQNTNSIPYNTAGYAMIEQSLQTEIQAAINFGAIRVGVTLSSSEALEVNTLAGFPIDSTITQQGWYLQIQPASPQTRAARQSPVMFFWYTDGQSVQRITMNSVEII